MLKEEADKLLEDLVFTFIVGIVLLIMVNTSPVGVKGVFLSKPSILGFSLVGAIFSIMLLKLLIKVVVITALLANKTSRRKIIGVERKIVRSERRFVKRLRGKH